MAMIVVYKIIEGQITRPTRIVMSQNESGLTMENVAPDLISEGYESFITGDDMEKLRSSEKCEIDFSGESPVLVLPQQKKIIVSCNKTEISERRYSMSKNDTAIITVSFKDHEDNPVTPEGTLELEVNRGSLSSRFITLNGGLSFVDETYTPVDETISINVKAKIQEDTIKQYDSFPITIELV